MKGSIKLFKLFGISINVHITFFLLLFLFLNMGIRSLALILGIFFFVTLHEVCHSLAARRFGIRVKEITLLPIGGVASMTKMPEKPYQEFFISIAGPLFNIAVIVIFYAPLYYILGESILFHPLSVQTWPLTLAHIYWLNLVLAVFNLIPAFPMDGGRILRSILAKKLGFQKATKIAVNFGHLFALIFGYIGLVHGHLTLVLIAIFIYMAASSEETQVDIKVTLSRFAVGDIMSRQFLTVSSEVTISKVLEMIFHSHQEDFPVEENGKMVGFVTRSDIMNAVHQSGLSTPVSAIMRKNVPGVREHETLDRAQALMMENNIKALPIKKGDDVVGVVTLEDILRVYGMMSDKR